MANVGADAPLFRACSDHSSSVDEIQRLIEEDPEALTKQDRSGRTPLHLARQFLTSSHDILRLLLDRCPPEAIGLGDNYGYTTLHCACLCGVSIKIIRRMIRIYPKALRTLTNNGETPLHVACHCIFESLDVIQLLASECPIVCLLNNSDGRTPYHESARFRRPAATLNLLLEATKQAALALVVFVECSSLITVSPAVIAHIHQVIPNFAQDYMSSNEPIRQALDDPQTLKALLNNNDLQEMIKDNDCQDVVCGMHRMMKACSRFNLEFQLESKHHISILESVSDAPDCFYIHLRNNPFLCCRSTRTTATPVPGSISTSGIQWTV
jgi:hypothetical protein